MEVQGCISSAAVGGEKEVGVPARGASKARLQAADERGPDEARAASGHNGKRAFRSIWARAWRTSLDEGARRGRGVLASAGEGSAGRLGAQTARMRVTRGSICEAGPKGRIHRPISHPSARREGAERKGARTDLLQVLHLLCAQVALGLLAGAVPHSALDDARAVRG